jgi:hypothetical protein
VNKPDCLTLLQLLAAFESLLLTNKVTVPDYLWDRLAVMVELLEKEVLE